MSGFELDGIKFGTVLVFRLVRYIFHERGKIERVTSSIMVIYTITNSKWWKF